MRSAPCSKAQPDARRGEPAHRSLFMEPDNYLNAIEFLLHFVQSDLADLLPGIEIIDFGGGLGIPYRKYEEEPRLDMAETRPPASRTAVRMGRGNRL